MKKHQILLLLNALTNMGQPMSAVDCAKLLNVSISSLKKDIRELKPLLSDHGCEIVGKSGLGNGYEINVIDHELYLKYVNKILPSQISNDSNDYNEQKNRIRFIIEYLLRAKDYTRSEDLADELSISRSQFSKDLTLAKEYFEHYKIELINKSHYGIKVRADEMAIRLCLANTYMNNMNFNDDNETNLKPNPSFNDD
jgi:lichenan operon transcriptional antiterminator